MYPRSINNLIESFKKLPGIGEKTAERLAFSTISLDEEFINDFSTSLIEVKKMVKKCPKCGHLTEEKICSICSSKSRDNKTICVVEDSQSIIMFEKLGVYNGIYFVLNGLISPLEDIGPEDINISQLVNRIKSENIEEVIIALKPSIESETTALYLLKLLENIDVIVTRIAQGIPMGADIQYIDSLTLERALVDRKKLS